MSADKVAVVTGASRGVGRGIALALADSGFRVFATGRTVERAELPAGITRLVCDHLRDDQTAAVFESVNAEAGSIDVLVNFFRRAQRPPEWRAVHLHGRL